MARSFVRLESRPRRVIARLDALWGADRNWQFARAVGGLIWEYRRYALGILGVTVLQELSALAPVRLLGIFVDRLSGASLGSVVWLFLGASLLAPAVARANVILRHKMFYETDFSQRVELTLAEAARMTPADTEAAGEANSRVANAVSGITNAAYHVLGSFTPVIIKIAVVAASLVAYNRLLGAVYVASLVVPMVLTAIFNDRLRVLRDAQYSIISRLEGAGVRVITQGDDVGAQERFRRTMRERANVLITLVARHQVSLLVRQAALVGSQFAVVFLAIYLRSRIGLTPGDFTMIVGYTTQVAAAFIEAAACLDAIMSYSRAYHVYVDAHGARLAAG
jgi:ABC-type multidrug transport system fused ATPase/permease subunit